MRSSTFGCALVLALVSGTTAARIGIEVGAQADQAWSDGMTFAPQVTRGWGWALASPSGGIGAFGTGPGPCDTIVCPPGPTLPGVAGGIARADASAMNLGVRAWGAGAGFSADGVAEVAVTDRLVTAGFTTLVFNIHIDLLLTTSADAGAEGRYSHSIRLGSGDATSVPFAFVAERRYTSASGYETLAFVLLNDGATEIPLAGIPSTYQVSLPILFAPGGTDILLSASAAAEAPGQGSTNVNAYNSAWLGVQGAFTSASGYGYPGYTAPIPEPAALALWATGLVGVCGWRGMRRRARTA